MHLSDWPLKRLFAIAPQGAYGMPLPGSERLAMPRYGSQSVLRAE